MYAAAKVSKEAVRAMPAEDKRYIINRPTGLCYHGEGENVPQMQMGPRKGPRTNFCAQPLISACIVGAAMARPQEENVHFWGRSPRCQGT